MTFIMIINNNITVKKENALISLYQSWQRTNISIVHVKTLDHHKSTSNFGLLWILHRHPLTFLNNRNIQTNKIKHIPQICILLHPFNGLFSRTTWVSQHQKGKPFWILLEQEMMGWQWHHLDHMQIICTSLQTDNH